MSDNPNYYETSDPNATYTPFEPVISDDFLDEFIATGYTPQAATYTWDTLSTYNSENSPQSLSMAQAIDSYADNPSGSSGLLDTVLGGIKTAGSFAKDNKDLLSIVTGAIGSAAAGQQKKEAANLSAEQQAARDAALNGYTTERDATLNGYTLARDAAAIKAQEDIKEATRKRISESIVGMSPIASGATDSLKRKDGTLYNKPRSI